MKLKSIKQLPQGILLKRIREKFKNQLLPVTSHLSKYFGRVYYDFTQPDTLVLDNDGTVLNWNKNMEELQGYSENEILGQHLSSFYPAHDRQNGLPDQLIKEAIKKGKAVHKGAWMRKDGSSFFAYMYLNTIKVQNEVLGFREILRKLD